MGYGGEEKVGKKRDSGAERARQNDDEKVCKKWPVATEYEILFEGVPRAVRRRPREILSRNCIEMERKNYSFIYLIEKKLIFRSSYRE